jgi:hypothetical protein
MSQRLHFLLEPRRPLFVGFAAMPFHFKYDLSDWMRAESF